MSDASGGPGWWQATDGKWYLPEQHPNYQPPAPPLPPPPPGWGPSNYPHYAGPSPGYGTNGLAIASLVVGIVWLWGIGSVLALVFGYAARKQIRATGGLQGGNGMATAGIVLGWVGVVGAILAVIAIIAVGSSVHHIGPTGPTP
jgi:hypothetical protein